jgi:Flp pilus assembly protein CpaB
MRPMLLWVLVAACDPPALPTTHMCPRIAGGQPIVLARHPLDAGSVITVDDVVPSTLPAAVPGPEGRTETVAAAIGAVVTEPILMFEPLSKSRLAPPHSAPGLAGAVRADYRAVNVPIDQAAADLLRSEDRVDIVASDANGPCALVSAARVIDTPGARGLWIEVHPAQVPMLIGAFSHPFLLQARARGDATRDADLRGCGAP